VSQNREDRWRPWAPANVAPLTSRIVRNLFVCTYNCDWALDHDDASNGFVDEETLWWHEFHLNY
jgi:hypothetical protein